MPNNFGEKFLKFYESILNCPNVSDVKIKSNIKDVVMISLNIKINLPFRRSKMKAIIKETEPILLMCSVSSISYEAPMVFSNRSDFPVEELPHVMMYNGSLPCICLHRGNINDWYIEHSTEDFINRIRQWYSDAASGRLIKDGDDFEPMLIYIKTGSIIYSYDDLIKFIKDYWNNHEGKSGYAFITYRFNNGDFNIDKDSFSIQITGIHEKNKLHKLIRNCNLKLNNKINEFIGILTWCSRETINDKYFRLSYTNLGELFNLNKKLENCFHQAMGAIKNSNIIGHSVVISAINRPTNLIGYSDNIELLNYIFKLKKIKIRKVEVYDNSENVLALKHLEAFTSNLALKMSGLNSISINKRILFVGVGALGSKVICHLARNGFNNITIIDEDSLYPHNLARHSLYTDSLSKNKAKEIHKKLDDIYSTDKARNFDFSTESFIKYAETNDLTNYDVLLDFTASKSVLSYLSDIKKTLPNLIIRGELANDGKLGLLMIEGENRKPQIDELQMILFKNALVNSDISEWLKTYKFLREENEEAQFEDIIIGIGCNTITMKLSDDIISYHASIFSNYIKQLICGEITKTGSISINYFNEKDYSKNYFCTIDASEFISSKCKNNEWTIKLYTNVWSNIKHKLNENYPKEVGGILIGYTDIKKKIIYVLDIFIPEDSIGSTSRFIKGIGGIKNYLDDVNNKTGGLLHYVGDWHTHPNGNTEMSICDKASLEKLRDEMGENIFPAHIMIFNNSNFDSYIL